jgi:hypothetical protein
VTLGLDDADMADVDGRSFGQLGGDSLAAIQFARAVSELCGVNLPVSFVLDHSHSLGAITAHVQGLVRCAVKCLFLFFFFFFYIVFYCMHAVQLSS